MFDSDGLIKLQKAGVLSVLAAGHECLVPKKVYEESVERGKTELYEDAFELEEIIEKHMRVVKEKKVEVGKSPTRENLGPGELSAYRVHLKEDSDALISDDRAFLKFLESQEIPFITPANGIVEMKNQEQISREKAIKALDRIRGLIRDEVYERAVEEVKK
ncbi:hypothetical protein AKJ37_01030 [candidate division MSBL1 archaeon SCGC-AAA259I09]|uniref:PIN domain-containing protein n=2 Tax=candidate division MSBL1 TaxID=215777 RepID=A0A133UTV6_9EURY|nr:hypothetical protein AKJ38_00815 [candidate division MSBL1 archaeon SCGC-AAA259I14]KXA98203.1 hypothetical protein AKJ37_01030 [candidate division MSBL1 archaeon SCGC-AAA259I09]